MAYADDLLELAQHQANLELSDSRQACLRRAISTAYYSLFHLLISEAALNWARPELRSELGRLFGHGKMKNAAIERRSQIDERIKKNPLEGPELALLKQLRIVADTFVELQQRREEADYDTGKEWTQTDALSLVEAVAVAFESWNAIREEPVAQAFLLSLLGKRPRSE
jgi:uncharacterized protein (UPF0332 family)